MVAIGEGRTYASAALNPGAFVSSGGVSEILEDIDGVVNLFLMFPGLIVAWLENSFLVLGSAFDLAEEDESTDEDRGTGERGNGLSSKEKIDRSSPFH